MRQAPRKTWQSRFTRRISMGITRQNYCKLEDDEYKYMLKKGLVLLLLAVVFQTPVKGLTLEASQAAIVSYDLAFPGMLPDHPLYKLKVVRDKIRLFLTADPKKRIEFYRLKADKEILATAMLVDKNKVELAGKTALKAKHNYTLLVAELRNFPRKKDPEDDREF